MVTTGTLTSNRNLFFWMSIHRPVVATRSTEEPPAHPAARRRLQEASSTMRIHRYRPLSYALALAVLVGSLTGCLCRLCPPKPPEPGPPPPEPPVETLARIEVDDGIEVALLEQELGLEPVKVEEGRILYYRPDAEMTRKLADLGYQPVRVDAAPVLHRVMRVDRSLLLEEAALVDAGATVLLREERYWIVRASYRQLQVLARLGYPLSAVEELQLHPRQVRIVVDSFAQIAEVGRAGVDIYNATPLRDPKDPYRVEQSERGDAQPYVVLGGAFDDAIDRLRELDLQVEILPDPQGVVR